MRPVEDTLLEVLPLCKKIGITRICDITYMDRLYIPNYSAILPGTEDTIWVYSGKGSKKLEAKASALMEAIERYSSLHSTYKGSYIQGSYSELSKSYNKVLHPAEVVESVNPEDKGRDPIMDYLVGVDILSNEDVLVPAEIALYKYSPKYPAISAFTHSHTNGLASGNVLEESISHALCEVIERDAASIADLCASSIPYTILDQILSLTKIGENHRHTISRIQNEKFVDDAGIFPDVDVSEIIKENYLIRTIVKRFSDSGLNLLIKDITQKDIGIPTFVASSIEWITHDYGYFAKGYGSHPDAKIALIRAITEVSQTRAANIHGARDDLKKIVYKNNDEIFKTKWQFMPASVQKKNNIINYSKISSFANKDVLQDVNVILQGLKKAGLKRAIIVDLTDPTIGIPTVRAVVPGLETFEVTKSIMGRRAKEYFKHLYFC
jgi:thioglycine synthase